MRRMSRYRTSWRCAEKVLIASQIEVNSLRVADGAQDPSTRARGAWMVLFRRPFEKRVCVHLNVRLTWLLSCCSVKLAISMA